MATEFKKKLYQLTIPMFVLSFLIIVLNIALLIIKLTSIGAFTLNLTSCQLYYQLKYANIAAMVIASTISICLVIGLAIAIMVLAIYLIRNIYKLNVLEDLEAIVGSKIKEVIFMLGSIALIFEIVVVGYALTFSVDSNSCSIGSSSTFILMIVLSFMALASLLVILILVFCLQKINDEKVDGKEINFQFIKNHQENAFLKQFQMQAKGYNSIYQKDNQLFKHLLTKEMPLKTIVQKPIQMIRQKEDQLLQHIDNEDEKQIQQEEEPWIREERQKIQKNQIRAPEQEDEIVSQTFKEDNFDIVDPKKKVLPNRNQLQNEFTPFELKKLVELSKQGYEIEKTLPREVVLSHVYKMKNEKKDTEKYKINISFAKSKAKRVEEEEKPEVQIEEDHKQQDQQLMFDSEAAKLARIKLYRERRPQTNIGKQYECPISRFVDVDQKIEQLKVAQTKFNAKNLKSKKKDISSERLIFSHKKKEVQGKVISEFNEDQMIRQERRQLFGQRLDDWMQDSIESSENGKKKMYSNKKLVEVIRSKYIL